MVDAAVHALALSLREALVIWFVLIVLAVLACALMAAPSWRDRLRERHDDAPARRGRNRSDSALRADRQYHTHGRYHTDPQHGIDRWNRADRQYRADRQDRHVQPHHLVSPHRTEDATDAVRYAEEVTVAARRAADAAERWRSEWLAVQSARDAAWHAYEVAHEAACRAYRAAAFPVPESVLTPEEHAARERYLHRAARQAYRRGELSLQQLADALAHRNGWDAQRHPFEQELILRRVGLERKLHAYRTVADMERTAWRTADLAQSARGSLREEAFAATVRARQATLAA